MSWADYLALVFAILMILNVLIQRSKDMKKVFGS